jgi:hypothetical protein
MGAAYLFHIVQNHSFVDGNKRTGLLSPRWCSWSTTASRSPTARRLSTT